MTVRDGREIFIQDSILEMYEMQTRTDVELVADAGADLVILGSLSELWAAAEVDQFRAVFSDTINVNIPATLRDAESRWAALSLRARLVFHNPDLTTPAELAALQAYADLGNETWRERLCLSSSRVPGNRVLIAFLIRELGVHDAEIAVRKWRANLAAAPFADDAGLIEAVYDGRCAIGIADSAGLHEFTSRHPERPVETRFFGSPDAMVVDVSGAGVSRHAANPEAAVAMLEWLTNNAVNSLFAISAHDYPANLSATPGSQAVVNQVKERIAPSYSLVELGFLLDEADRLIERAGYP